MRYRPLYILLLTGSVVSLTFGAYNAALAQKVDSQAPEFSLEVLQGDDAGTLVDLRGKVVIIEFWATYCAWCKKTHPTLAKFSADHTDDIVVLGITAQRKSRVLRYLRKTKTGLTIAHDPKGRTSRAYGARVTPTLVLIDRQGVVRKWTEGGNNLAAVLRRAQVLVK